MQVRNEQVNRAVVKTTSGVGWIAALWFCFAGIGNAQQIEPVVVDGPAGQAVYINQAQKEGNDAYGFAAAFRAGDFVFVSGVVAGSWDGEVLDVDGLKASIRSALTYARQTLQAAGTDYDHVVEIVSFHIWDSELFAGDKAAQLQAIVDVKREYMREPDPAWTAVGTTELVPDRGIMEIRLTAYIPPEAP